MSKPRSRFLASVGASLLALGLVGSAGAAVVNGGFETGDLAGWTGAAFGVGNDPAINWAGAVGAAYMAPLRGNFSALLVAPTSDSRDCVIEPWSVGCSLRSSLFAQPLAGPALANAFPNPLFAFQAPGFGLNVRTLQYIGQDIQLDAGTGISLEWRWLSNDHEPDTDLFSGMNPGDHGFAFITNGVDFVGLNAKCPVGAYGPINFSSTGFQDGCDMLGATLRAPSSGLWTLYIGVANGMDTLTASGLMVDDVQVVRIPVPGSASLAGLALAVLAAVHRKRIRGPRAPA